MWGTEKPDGLGVQYRPKVVADGTRAITFTHRSVSERLSKVQ